MTTLSEADLASLLQDNKKIYTQFLDLQFTSDLVKNVLEPIDECYFRSRFIGFEPLPERNNAERPLIYASNHSGMAFPWDGIMFTMGIFKKSNYNLSKAVRVLTSPMLSQSTLMNPFLVENFWKKAGSVDATMKNFETMMHYKDSDILVYPEGVPGIGKGFDKRYKLQRFATSFVRMSLKYRTDIIPVATVNGEYINPYAYHWETLNKLVNKVGIPFLPVGFMTLLIPFQPWLFYFGFPAKLTYVMGKRIKPYEMLDKPLQKITEDELHALTGEIKGQMQRELEQAVQQYGGTPYASKEFFSNCRRNAKRYPYFLPFFWPSLFAECERLSGDGKAHDLKIDVLAGVRAFRKSPLTFAFFLPLLGWIPILFRGWKHDNQA